MERVFHSVGPGPPSRVNERERAKIKLKFHIFFDLVRTDGDGERKSFFRPKSNRTRRVRAVTGRTNRRSGEQANEIESVVERARSEKAVSVRISGNQQLPRAVSNHQRLKCFPSLPRWLNGIRMMRKDIKARRGGPVVVVNLMRRVYSLDESL
jgi:hypothetical protein